MYPNSSLSDPGGRAMRSGASRCAPPDTTCSMTTVGGDGVELDAGRIGHREALDRREPEPAVAVAPGAVLAFRCTRREPCRVAVENVTRSLMRPGSLRRRRELGLEIRNTPRLLVSQRYPRPSSMTFCGASWKTPSFWRNVVKRPSR